MKAQVWLMSLLAAVCTHAAAHYTCPDDVAANSGSQTSVSLPKANDLGVPDVYESQMIGPATAAANQGFGRGLALEGNTLAIAVDDLDGGNVPEKIELFTFSEGLWQRNGSVTSPNAHQYEHFYEVALEADLMLVGAYGYCATNPANQCRNGAAYLFRRTAGVDGIWTLIKQLDGGLKPDARFGINVDLDANIAVVTADAETINSVWGAGAVYIFERDRGGSNQWGLVKRIESDAPLKVEGDFFGQGVTLHGDTLLALGDNGSVLYEFNRNEGGVDNWGLVQKLPVPNGIAQFAFDGETLALSIMDPCTPIEVRKVWLALYSRDAAGAWQQDQLIEGDYDPFRIRDIALEGNTLIGHTQDYESAAFWFERSGHPEKWALKAVLQSTDDLQLRYGRIALDAGRGLVSYDVAEVDGRVNEGVVFFYELADPVNTGHAGAWANLSTLGQGQLIDVDAEQQFIFISWFTYTDADSANPNEQRWLTAQGHYSGSEAILPLYETLGGRFDDSQPVQTNAIGEVTLNFTNCSLGRMSYRIDGEELSGDFPIERVIPGSDGVCQAESGNALQAVDINAGMDGAWYDENTPGQGFLFDVQPDPEGGNFIFVAWFTYGDDTASGQRWLTAQGPFEGSRAEIDVYETTGGSFDDPQATETSPVGTMTIDFSDCANAVLDYALDDAGPSGRIDLTRLMPATSTLCEGLAGQD